jgi:putative flippase GtrA
MLKLKKFLKTPLGKYIILGGGVYLIELLVIVLAQQLGASAVAAVGLSFWIGLAISFGLQKVVTFDDRRAHRKVLLPQVAAYCLLVLFNFSFTILVTDVLSPAVPPAISRTLALAVTTIWNFYLYKTRIFNQDNIPVY